MRRSRNKIKIIIDWKKYLGIFIIGIIAILLVIIAIEKKKGKVLDRDFKLGIISNDQIQLVSISLDRKMVNVLKVKLDVPVWLPNGLGWYRVNQIEKILTNKKSNKLYSDLFWYNFGFSANKIIINNDDKDYKNDWLLLTNMGLVNFIKYKSSSSQMLYKEELISTDILENEELLDEVMPRDFADNKVLNEDIKLSVFNGTSESGLADFISQRLEWAGITVISTDNSNQPAGKCLLIYGPKVADSLAWKILLNSFDCKTEFSQNLNEDEAELYLGEDFVSMIKYSSYKRNF